MNGESRWEDSRLGVFVACFFISVAANGYFIAPASVLPLLVGEFSVTKTVASLAISTAIFGTVLSQIPCGFLMDRYDNRRLMAAATAVFLPVSVVGVVLVSYPLFLASRFVAGVAAGVLFVLGTNVVSQLFAGRNQGFMMTVFIASAPVGFAFSQFSGPPVAAAFGWEATFLTYPLLAAAGFVLFRLSWSTPIQSGDPISLAQFGMALRNRSVLVVSVSAFCSYMLYIFFNSWMPTYATEVLPLTLVQAGAVTSLLPAVGVVARPVGGWVSDALGYRRRVVVAASLLFSLPGLYVVAAGVSPTVFAVTMLCVGFSIQFGSGVYYVYARELATENSGGTTLALFTTIAFTGTLVSPTVGGWLISAVSWSATFAVYVGIGLFGIGILLLSTDSRPNAVA
ncbi:MFS transporter [Natrinema sp. DC36]|uniref:MFS transporter n=1 Tax=Natrinema sp. DC36 TaxID=2878680 RepID=UPI001CF0BC1E|nr:MFS transporter [Natrinema sp. DC36]